MMTGHLFGQSVQNNGKPCRILHVFSGVPTGRRAEPAARLLPYRTAQMQSTPVVTHMQSDTQSGQSGTVQSYRFDLTVSDSLNNLGSAARWSIEREGKPAAAKPESRSHIPERYREKDRE